MKLRNLLIFSLITLFLALPLRSVWAGQMPIHQEHPIITPEELIARLNKGEKVVILDVRNEGQYKSSSKRIKGDIRIEEDSDLDTKLKDVPREQLIVAYCT